MAGEDARDLAAVAEPVNAEEDRRAESEIMAAFEAARPAALGALLDAVCSGLQNLPGTKPDRIPRMADFALVATAAECRRLHPTDTLTRFTPTVAGDANVTIADLLRTFKRTRKRLPNNASAALLESLEFEIQQIGVNDK